MPRCHRHVINVKSTFYHHTCLPGFELAFIIYLTWPCLRGPLLAEEKSFLRVRKAERAPARTALYSPAACAITFLSVLESAY